MALGKEIGQFSLKMVLNRILEINGESSTSEISWEGEVSGGELAGTVMVTGESTGTNEGGSFSIRGVGFLASGGTIRGEGSGTYELTGPARWKTRGLDRLTSGQVIATEGEVDLSTRTWSGKIFEWS